MVLVRRVVRYMVVTLLAAAVAVVAAVAVLARTDFGVERAGRYVVERLQGSINGTMTVGRFSSGGLLRGVTLHDVEIADAEGRPFVRADSARLAYRIGTLLRGSVVFDRVMLYGPDVTIERIPGFDGWNYDRIFADTTAPADTAAGSGLILIHDATVHDGRVTVRLPWDEEVGADTSRLVLESVPGGRVRTLRFEEVRARLPRVVWEAPGAEGQIFEIEGLTTRAYLWRTPLAIEAMDGVVTLQDSVVNVVAERVRLPASELTVDARIVVGAETVRYDVEAVGGRVAFRDFRWLYPPLPTEGGGSLRFRMQSQPSGEILYLARDAELAARGNQLAGSFGVVIGETVRFTDVDVRAAPLDLDFLAALLPDGLPVSGLVIGTIAADGPVTAFRSRGDVRYRTFDADGNGAESTVRWSGVLGGQPPYPLRDVEAELQAVDLAQVAQFAPELRIRGVARGTVRADGSIRDGLRVDGEVSLTHGDARSSVRGSGRFALGGTPTFDLQFDAEPVALELLALQVPALDGLRGEARGPVTVSGSLDDLTVGADIATPAGGLVVQGNLSLAGDRPRYYGEGSITEFRLDRVAPRLPETVVSGRFAVDGAGFQPGDVDGQLSVDLLGASVDGVTVYGGALRGRVSDGVVRVDSFSIATEVGDARAGGSFGLVEGRDGRLEVSLRADSLMFLEPLLFADATPPDMGLERPTRIDGTVTLDGRVSGSLAEWRVDGTARARSLLYDELELGRGRVDVSWHRDSLRIEGQLDSLRHGPRRLAGVRGGLTFAEGRGSVAGSVQGRRSQQLDVESTFEVQGSVTRLGLRRLRLVTRDGEWALADTALVTLGGEGFSVDSMVLVRGPAHGRVSIAGVLPWRQTGAGEVQVASLALELDSVRIGEFLRVAQTDTLVDGVVTGGFRVTGTALAPRVDGGVYVRGFRYGGAVLDSVRGRVSYADRQVESSFSGWQDGAAIVTGEVQAPVDLALTDREQRLLDEPMTVRFQADGVPAGLLAFLAPGFNDLDGRVRGDLAVMGTPVAPDLRGALELEGGSAFFEPLGVRYSNVRAAARLLEGPDVQLDASLATASGRGQVRGTLDLTVPGDPVFDLRVFAQRLDAARRRDVTAVVDGEARLQGRYTRPEVSGDVLIVRGEMNLDEIWRQYQIVQLDTTLFQMMDTTGVSYRPTPESPFLQNLRVTATNVRTGRNFWLRSQELNVEVSGSLAMEVDRQTDDLRLTGALQVVGGSYQLLARGLPSGRRFEIRQGTVEFVGTPGIDPNLDIEAAYRVRRAQGEPINVIASVAGTLQDPRVSLSSDSEIPMSETDLASYILFGRAGAELTQAQLDAASGGALAAGLFSPVVSGAASSGIQQVAASLGLPVDYVAFSLPEYGPGWQDAGSGLFQNAQIEVGFDPIPNVSVIGSVRIPGSEAREDRASALRLFGARIEYRPWQTWTIEGFIEDQFARTPSFGPGEIADRKVWGWSLLREWGY